jgi:hypothetical protein
MPAEMTTGDPEYKTFYLEDITEGTLCFLLIVGIVAGMLV